MITVQDALTLAVRSLHSGDSAGALAICRRILAALPDQAAALHLSGVALRRQGSPKAAAGFERALAAQPDLAEALIGLAGVRHEVGEGERAAATFRRAARLRPTLAEAHEGLAATLAALGRPEEAAAALREGTAARPDHAGLANALGNALQVKGDSDGADAAYRAALAADPAHAGAWANRAALLRGSGRLEDCLTDLRRALRLAPAFPAALDGMGLALLRLDRPREALARHARAIALQPGFAEAWANLGSAQLAVNRVEQAIAAFRRAVTLAPALADAHRNLGIALLLAGDLAQGWPEYEWRLRCADSPSPALPRPQWTGGPLEGRTILLHAEQGLGDVLQFVRYVPLVADRGARVVLCAPPALERLLASLPGMSRFVPGGTPFSLAGIDLHAPLMSLPHAFETMLDGIPAGAPYIMADPGLTADWRDRLDRRLGPRGAEPYGAGLRVGVVWAGSPGHGNDRNRSLPLDAVLPLAGIPGVRLVSVQKGPPADLLAERARHGGPAAAILDLGPEIADFADTAAILESLDLLVTVDTSVAHLAGALGRPAWVLLPFAPDWRWMLHRTDNPWYPTLRLFRQASPGDWGPVLAEVSRRLSSLTGS